MDIRNDKRTQRLHILLRVVLWSMFYSVLIHVNELIPLKKYIKNDRICDVFGFLILAILGCLIQFFSEKIFEIIINKVKKLGL